MKSFLISCISVCKFRNRGTIFICNGIIIGMKNSTCVCSNLRSKHDHFNLGNMSVSNTCQTRVGHINPNRDLGTG